MAAPCAAYMVSAQLQRSWVGRKIFPGIGVARRKDRDRAIHADNHLATQRCVSHLAAGGHLFILPEGTSSLGPRHLPFRSGALVIALEALKRGLPLHVVPVAVNYECAWEWQSRVEVVIGEPMTLTLADAVSTDELAARMTAALGADRHQRRYGGRTAPARAGGLCGYLCLGAILLSVLEAFRIQYLARGSGDRCARARGCPALRRTHLSRSSLASAPWHGERRRLARRLPPSSVVAFC